MSATNSVSKYYFNPRLEDNAKIGALATVAAGFMMRSSKGWVQLLSIPILTQFGLGVATYLSATKKYAEHVGNKSVLIGSTMHGAFCAERSLNGHLVVIALTALMPLRRGESKWSPGIDIILSPFLLRGLVKNPTIPRLPTISVAPLIKVLAIGYIAIFAISWVAAKFSKGPETTTRMRYQKILNTYGERLVIGALIAARTGKIAIFPVHRY